MEDGSLATGPVGGDASVEYAQAVLVEQSSPPDTKTQYDWIRPYINPSYRIEHTGWNQWDYTAAERSGIRRWNVRSKRAVELRTGSCDTTRVNRCTSS